MKKIRYSEDQIIGILKEAEAGTPVTELCRKYGISDATYFNWKARYGGMTTSEMKRLPQLEDENRRTKYKCNFCQRRRYEREQDHTDCAGKK